jgi:5-methylcytosine-specific restriction endonuclease McrA
MGMLPLRACAKSSCYATALRGSKFCPKHQNADAIRDREYKNANVLRRLYGTIKWKFTRLFVLSRDAICTYVENGVRCVRLSTDCHHVIPAQKFVADGGDFFDANNLAGLCREHHSRATSKEVGFAGWNKNG